MSLCYVLSITYRMGSAGGILQIDTIKGLEETRYFNHVGLYKLKLVWRLAARNQNTCL